MKRLTKAYLNEKFLTGEDARALRILCEYLEPENRFKRKNINKAVIVFGSARISSDVVRGVDYYAKAAEFAEQFARWTMETHARPDRYYVCTGGGGGIMQAIHEGAARVNRHLNIGLNISLPFEQNLNPHVEREHALEFHYFFMRKFWFMNLARAAVIFPGGFGTMDELFELLTLTQTGKSAKMPIILYGKKFWQKTIDFSGLARMGVISKSDLKLFHICDSADEAMAVLKKGLAVA